LRIRKSGDVGIRCGLWVLEEILLKELYAGLKLGTLQL
jgi:hypothetical protein